MRGLALRALLRCPVAVAATDVYRLSGAVGVSTCAGSLAQDQCIEALVALCRLAPERVMLWVVQLLLPRLQSVTSSQVVAALTALQ